VKKKGLYIIMYLALITLLTHTTKADEWQKVFKSAETTGASFDKLEIEGHGVFNSRESLISLANQFYKATGFTGTLKILQTKNQTTFTSKNFTLKIKNLTKENNKYASIILSQYVEVKNINNIRNAIYKGFSIFDIEPTFSYLIEEKYLKKMTIDEMKSKAGEILSLCGSKKIYSMEDRNLVSYVGYDPSINEKINVLDQNVNLNVALRTDRSKGNTYLWVGCPVIPIEY
jgi:hypothetical protein